MLAKVLPVTYCASKVASGCLQSCGSQGLWFMTLLWQKHNAVNTEDIPRDLQDAVGTETSR